VLAALPLIAPSAAAAGGEGGGIINLPKLLGVMAAIRHRRKTSAAAGAASRGTAQSDRGIHGCCIVDGDRDRHPRPGGGALNVAGAFLAGVLLADSEFRHELEADLEPFKGLLLGLFFVAVGMAANLGLLQSEPLRVLAVTGVFLAIKLMAITALGRAAGHSRQSAWKLGFHVARGRRIRIRAVHLGRA